MGAESLFHRLICLFLRRNFPKFPALTFGAEFPLHKASTREERIMNNPNQQKPNQPQQSNPRPGQQQGGGGQKPGQQQQGGGQQKPSQQPGQGGHQGGQEGGGQHGDMNR
jgi:type VI secretion system secreted protein VgrG